MHKNRLFVAIAAAFALLSGVKTQAQTYSTGHLHVTAVNMINHDSTSCLTTWNSSFTITVDSSYVGDTLRVVDTAGGTLVSSYTNVLGTSPWNVSTSLATQNRDDMVVAPGDMVSFYPMVYKVVSNLDTQFVTMNDSMIVTNPCGYGTVSGTIYADNNGNCIFDSGDVGLSNIEIDITDYLSSPTGMIYQPISSSGATYNYPVQQSWMTHYTVALPSYVTFVMPYSSCFTGPYSLTTLPGAGLDFPLQCTNLVDVQAGELAPPSVRLHRSFFLNPYVSNLGCDTVSGVLTLVKDSRAIYDAALTTVVPDVISGDTLQWYYSGLSNLTSGAYWNSFISGVHVLPDSTLAVGDSLCFLVYTGIPPTDVNPANNQYSMCLPVVYSYDPNLKEVSPKGAGPEGFIHAGTDTLTYTLHFQNTGTDYAYNVAIIDTLDSHINPATLRILGTSAHMLPKWDAPGVVEFDFDNIFLPDSSMSDAGSQGEVKFSVVLNPGLAPGTQIRNTGYIYFDSNPAVVTNTTLNTLFIPTGTNAVTANKPVRVFPNPATDCISIENVGDGQILIVDMNGVVVGQQMTTGEHTTMDIHALPAGIYLLKAINEQTTTTVKLSKF